MARPERARRIRRIFQRLIYAGLKPGAPLRYKPRPALLSKWLEPLLFRGLNPGEPTPVGRAAIFRKLKKSFVLAASLAVVVVLIGLYFMTKPKVAANPAATAAPVIPPNFLSEPIRTDKNADLEIAEYRIVRQPAPMIVGSVRNRSGKRYSHVEASFDLTDQRGSNVGLAIAKFQEIPPHGEVPFRLAVTPRVVFALVRELRAPE